VLTRSDHYFVDYFHNISTFEENTVSVSDIGDRGGINSNIIVIHKNILQKVLTYIKQFLNGEILNYVHTNKLENQVINEEMFFKYAMNANSVKINYMKNMWFISADNVNDNTSISSNGNIYKYSSDYESAIKYLQNKGKQLVNLTTIANMYKSDKGTTYKCGHQYTIYYENILNYLSYRLNINKINLLEIGLNRDDQKDIPSLKLWNDYMENNINIYGFDICKEFLRFNGKYKNIKIYCGDQSNPNDLKQLYQNKYNIIVDDGYHATKHQQISFKTLWKTLEPQGIYVIEDLHFQPIQEKCMKTKDLLIEWQKGNYIASEFINANEVKSIKDEIEKIEFFDSKSKIWDPKLIKNALVLIYKKR
jgi:hypothetical protein